MIDLNLLLAFEAMLLHQNVTAAATHLGLTQSAMSSALGRLRAHFEDPLFVNTRSGMLPTPRALALAGPFREALRLVRASTEKRRGFDPRHSRRTIRFHMSDVGEMVFLPALVRRLDEIGATVKLETVQITSDDVATGLESGDIDFAVGYLPNLSKRLAAAPLFREHYVCMTRHGHPLARKGRLTVKNFLAGSHVLVESLGSGHRIIERTLRRRGIERDFALRVPHFLVIPMIVAGTDRIVTIPSRVATAFSRLVNAEVYPLPVAIPKFDVALFWHPRFAHDAPLQWMRGLMIELFQEHRATLATAP